MVGIRSGFLLGQTAYFQGRLLLVSGSVPFKIGRHPNFSKQSSLQIYIYIFSSPRSLGGMIQLDWRAYFSNGLVNQPPTRKGLGRKNPQQILRGHGLAVPRTTLGSEWSLATTCPGSISTWRPRGWNRRRWKRWVVFGGFGAEFFQDLSHQNGKLSLKNVGINLDFIVKYLYNLKEFWL